MTIGTFSKLALAVAFVGCTTAEPPVAKPTTVTQGQLPTGCPLGVVGALATIEDSDQGVALTFLGPADRVDELRVRARNAGAMHGNDAHLGLGHAGAHGQGGQHGLQAMQLPPSRATVTDIEGGARIVVLPVDAADRATLVAKAHDGIRRMNGSACR